MTSVQVGAHSLLTKDSLWMCFSRNWTIRSFTCFSGQRKDERKHRPWWQFHNVGLFIMIRACNLWPPPRPDVPTGVYLLSVISPDYSFDQVGITNVYHVMCGHHSSQLRIDVLDSETKPEVRPYVAGTPLNPPSTILLSYPIKLVPRQKHVYFMPPESFNLMAMFSNPMMLIMVFGGIMVFAMPYIMVILHEQMSILIFMELAYRVTWTQKCWRKWKDNRVR